FDESVLGGVSDFTEFDFGGYGLNLTWTVPLFDNQASEAVRRRKLERTQFELRLQDLRTILSVRLQSVLRTLRLAQRQVEVAQISVALQQELLQNEIERLKLGRSTGFQVAQIQQDAAEARQNEILARVGSEKAFLEMLVLTGEIYSAYNLPAGDSKNP
ncbi:MAG: TolC family protein, partial [SAR324 cluster bacterium]|nr:TolC family protein [SAR324 cluster bacterium]